jgi:WD40 repeat protein
LAWDSGSRTLFSASEDKSVKVWREADGSFAEAQSLGGHSSYVNALAWDSGSHTLFSASGG